jgi:peptidoglycan/LPS O-acetylase OafA/YrhL
MILAAASTHRSQPTFRADLQGLRAIAVSLVVLSHAGVSWLPGGFIGVDVFFVLSGYLITGLLIREFEQTGRIDLLGFYTRRLKRLLPALALMIAFTVGLAGWLLAPFEARAQLASAPYAATWTSNLYFTFTTFDYFDELASRDLFLHTWSLGVEEQFYLVWPLLLLALLLAGPAGRQVRSSVARVKVLGIVTLAALASSLLLSSHSPTWAFYLMPSRIWQFSLGAIVYVALAPDNRTPRLPGQQTHLPPWFPHIAFYGGLLLILGSALWLHPGLSYPGPWAVFPSVGAALLIAAGQKVATKQPDLLAHKYMVWLGDRSYSLYLWHWPLLMLGYSFGAQGKPFIILGLVLCALLAAMFSYQIVELPFWKGRYSVSSPARALLVSVLVMLSIPALQIHMPSLFPARGRGACRKGEAKDRLSGYIPNGLRRLVSTCACRSLSVRDRGSD